VCLIQADIKATIVQTVENAVNLIRKAVQQHKPKIVALSECFYSPYVSSTFVNIAEPIPDGFTSTALRGVAKELGVYVVSGTIIERDTNGLYNTSAVWGPNGELVARHRKVHLCDIHMGNGLDIDEVSYLKPGNEVTTFEIDGVKFGLAICYDGFHHEFINLYAKLGCKVLFFPNAYNVEFGEKFWKIVHRSLALQNQLYVAAISSARNENRSFVAYGHSMVINPYAEIIAEAGEREEIVCAEINLYDLEIKKRGLPLHTSRRPDIYNRKDFVPL